MQPTLTGGFDSGGRFAILLDPVQSLGGTVFDWITAMHGKKPHKGLLKRCRVTKSGKIKVRVANGSHLRSQKSPEHLRNFRKARYISDYGLRKRIGRLLGMTVTPAKRSPESEAEVAKAKS
jgi:ribosomal protein L35